MFNPVKASDRIKEEYIDYITTLFHISDKECAVQFEKELKKSGMVAKGPYLDISDSYKTGRSISELIDIGEASPLFRDLEGDIADNEKELQIDRSLYLHQEKALMKTNKSKNLIVTTGTGSGKTECFIIPIINHLLREAEKGELSSGVRAILIYPMNALANDQMKRLRKLLKNYPDITFGVYNSSTATTEKSGIAAYGQIYKDSKGNPSKPLTNEMVSRERMQETPPHILVTNYAMLEYMMLRPKDDKVFSGAKLRYLVLDEAHIYRGATGMETSLLLKRLKARISNPADVIHILTSATLGGKEADNEIVQFGETLCNAHFDREDIIRSQSIHPSYSEEIKNVPIKIFADMVNPSKPLNEIAADYGLGMPKGESDSEFLYDLCTGVKAYRNLRSVVDTPKTVQEITGELRRIHGNITEEDVVNIISVASKASKNKSSLIKARYHMFVKALEGAYITIGMPKQLMLTRRSETIVNGKKNKVFECAVCDDCGRIAVAGEVKKGHLEFSNNSRGTKVDYYMIKKQHDISFDDEDEEEYVDVEKLDYILCSKCGCLFHESMKNDSPCTCGKENYVQVRKARKTNSGQGKCPNCNDGRFRTFYLGYDAATAVIGTAMYEELPETEKVLKSDVSDRPKTKNLFAKNAAQSVDIVRRKRQFLSFSDSRGEAAFFASYMTASYKEFLRRRGIWHVIKNNRENMAKHPWEIKDFVNELTSYFDSNKTFAEPDSRSSDNLTAVSRKNAWIAILNEMVNARRSTSLASLGIIKFNYKGNTEDTMTGVAMEYGQSLEDTKALFDIIAMDIVYHGAIEGDCDLTDDDRDYIFYTSVPKRVKMCKDPGIDKNKSNIASWMAQRRKNGSLVSNGRLKRVMRTLNLSEAEANELLETYWKYVLLEDLSASGDGEYYFNTDKFTVQAGTDEVPLYECDVCGKRTMMNCQGHCMTLKCTGHLKQIDRDEVLSKNHYAKLYSSSIMSPLYIKEHTAQLGREEQQKYQEMFVDKKINALSCSTTFEMGVDVGDLETVYLRNVPPSPANYVQRAGRAGRGRDAAAFSLTYAKLSSHDFTYYKNPEKMITGKIGVPLFTVKNEKVILRHIFAVALSDFFSKQEDVYDSNNCDVLLNGDGWERLCSYLESKPEHLKNLLRSSIPQDMHEIMGINDYSWVDKLIGKDGMMRIAVEEYRATVDYYEKEFKRLIDEGEIKAASDTELALKKYRRGKEDNKGKNELIEFLARNNILPKYGFPVDTVELYTTFNKTQEDKLQMVRDLQLAISEYAPDSQVVADGKMYTSRYIRKLPQTTGHEWETVYIAECGNEACKTWNYRKVEPGEAGTFCVSCNELIDRNRWKKAIEPRSGFVADGKPKAVPMRRPEKAYRSDDYYIGDPQRQEINKLSFVMEDGNAFQMATSVNDSLMVVCNDNFYVCPRCGYAESTTENMDEDGFNPNKKTLEKKHVTPWGKKCDIKLQKNKLCHVFKTDVVRIVFSAKQAADQEVMLSVMYALLESMSSVLDIERNDIKGCLHKIKRGKTLMYSIILYDAVAGGAGHVRRLVTENGEIFRKIVDKAIDITRNCNCSPSCYSCLRNYYNQKIHDKLNRKYAYDFLENYVGEMEPITDDEFEKTVNLL